MRQCARHLSLNIGLSIPFLSKIIKPKSDAFFNMSVALRSNYSVDRISDKAMAIRAEDLKISRRDESHSKMI